MTVRSGKAVAASACQLHFHPGNRVHRSVTSPGSKPGRRLSPLTVPPRLPSRSRRHRERRQGGHRTPVEVANQLAAADGEDLSDCRRMSLTRLVVDWWCQAPTCGPGCTGELGQLPNRFGVSVDRAHRPFLRQFRGANDEWHRYGVSVVHCFVQTIPGVAARSQVKREHSLRAQGRDQRACVLLDKERGGQD
jgi:hypothetical protein